MAKNKDENSKHRTATVRHSDGSKTVVIRGDVHADDLPEGVFGANVVVQGDFTIGGRG